MVDIAPTSFSPQQTLVAPSAEELVSKAPDQRTARATKELNRADSESGSQTKQERSNVEYRVSDQGTSVKKRSATGGGVGQHIDVMA